MLAHPPCTVQTKTGKVEQSTLNMTRDRAATSESGYIYETSEYKAEGLIGGRVAATHTVKAPGVMSRIDLEADGAGREFTADGNDWMRVYAKVCDKRGTVHPFADDLVAFSVEGEGAIVGNAAIGANPVRAEAGIATVLIRSTATPGRIKVRATAFGLKPAEIEIESKPPVATELK